MIGLTERHIRACRVASNAHLLGIENAMDGGKAMQQRRDLILVATAALALAVFAAFGAAARAQTAAPADAPPAAAQTAKPSDYGVTPAIRPNDDPVDKGAFIYKQRCAVCHARAADGKTEYGPHLAGIFGRKAATTGWDGHTRQFKAMDTVWNDAALDALLTDPQAAAPGIKMDVVVRFKRSREALIAYLKTL